MDDPLALGLLVAGLLCADGLAQPSSLRAWRLRSLQGNAVLLGAGALSFNLLLVATGASLPSMILVVMAAGVLSLASNIKRQVLGEPLVFSDLALVGALFRHPQFYLTALRPWQLVIICLGLAGVLVAVFQFSTLNLSPRLAGLGLSIASAVWLVMMLELPSWRILGEKPEPDGDIGVHGLIATLLVYWHLWSRKPDLAPCELPAVAGEKDPLVVIVQCESFADPVAMFPGEEQPLAGLSLARSLAWRSGRLEVSGFGAYTMRTEFGALFGIPESRLGLDRFDPFLTAVSAASYSVPHRLGKAWTCIFVHPHDLRFYGRDKLMPAIGFGKIVGEEAFPVPTSAEGRYVTDAAMCDKILEVPDAVEGPCLIYAVTIENHGPWSTKGEGIDANKAEYLRLLGRSDAMLSRLIEELPRTRRPVILCFFGDHRPSIPSVSVPGGERHTPFVILKFDSNGEPVLSPSPERNITPAELHSEILAAIGSG